MQLWLFKARLALHSGFTPNLQKAGLLSPGYVTSIHVPVSLLGVDKKESNSAGGGGYVL